MSYEGSRHDRTLLRGGVVGAMLRGVRRRLAGRAPGRGYAGYAVALAVLPPVGSQ